jgi:isoprenylcysteine carboxyl methyltransferase (ICMT) family protein YpbQ
VVGIVNSILAVSLTTAIEQERNMTTAKAISAAGGNSMGLKAPGLLTFMLAVILTVCIVVVKFFAAEIPWIKGHEFWALFVAHMLLLAGCLSRSL